MDTFTTVRYKGTLKLPMEKTSKATSGLDDEIGTWFTNTNQVIEKVEVYPMNRKSNVISIWCRLA